MDLLDFLEALLTLENTDWKYCKDDESVLKSAAEKLDLSAQFDDWIKDRKKRWKNTGYTAKSAAGLLVALVVLLIFILMAAYLKVVFFGFLLAYLFLPLAKWYRKHLFETGFFQRVCSFFSKLFLPLIHLKKALWKQVGFMDKKNTLAGKAAAKREFLAGHAAGVTVLTFITGICLLLVMIFCIFVPYIMDAGKQLNHWALEKNFVNRLELSLNQTLRKVGL